MKYEKTFCLLKFNFLSSQVDCVQRKMDENHAEFNSRVLESGQLLDIRADRIKKLEKYIFLNLINPSIYFLLLEP